MDQPKGRSVRRRCDTSRGPSPAALETEPSGPASSDFQAFQQNCDLLLAEFISVAAPRLAQRAQAVRRRLWNERLKVLVVGEFSRGKSTLINALIGEPILPSKVNPTTATINVLTGETPRSATVIFADGSSKDLDLPAGNANRYLDGIVTTSNRQASQIRLVKIQIPGRLSKLKVDIIDTPGVNDLDEMREEITFGFLRQADAAIVILDAQQPLSNSERTFLKEKILGNDVRRVMFVVNKIDEVLTSGSVNDIPRIFEFIRSKLRKELSIPEPIVHGVSAKCALRARFRNEPDHSPVPFEVFESALLRFATQQATGGRLQTHIDQLHGLILEQQAVLDQQLGLCGLEIEEVEQQLAALEYQDQCLRLANARLIKKLEVQGASMGHSIEQECIRQTEILQNTVMAALLQCHAAVDVDPFRTQLANGLRDLVQAIEQFAWQQRTDLRKQLHIEFSEYLGHPGAVSIKTISSARRRGSCLSPTWQTLRREQSQSTTEPLVQTLSESGAGSLGRVLFGFLSMARNILDRLLMSDAEKQERSAALARTQLDEAVLAVKESCAHITQRAYEVGQEVAKREVEALSVEMHDWAEDRSDAMQCTARRARGRNAMSRQQREENRRELETQLQRLAAMEDRCKQLIPLN